MGKVIAFDKNRVRSRSQTRAYAEGLRSQASVCARPSIHPFPSRKNEIAVSVIVSTRNQPHLLSHCLASLLFQQFDASHYEILVVEEKFNSATHDIVNDWAKHVARTGPVISYIAGHGRGLAAARNRGWRAARGAIVAFTEAGTVVRPDWLQKALRSFDDSVQAVWGRIVTPGPIHSPEAALHEGRVQPPPHSASNYFIRKAWMEQTGGFDERFRDTWVEEVDIYLRLCGQRSRIVHNPYAVVTYPCRRHSLSSRLATQRHHQADVLLYRKHPQLYRQKIRGTPNWETYLIVTALILAAVCALAGSKVLAVASAMLWGLLTLRMWKRQWRAANYAPSRCMEALCSAILLPPLEVFWHGTGLLRFRRVSR